MSRKNCDFIEKKEIVQAVLIANAFGDDLRPISDDLPLALFPLVNRPVIEYTLECLLLGGIKEVFIFCTYHADSIKKYIRQQQEQCAIWSQSLKITVIVSETCASTGDCLRDLDAKGLIRGGFVLCGPGVVSNHKLKSSIRTHLKTCDKDKGAVMTLIHQVCEKGKFGRCPKDDIVVASNMKGKVIYYKKVQRGESDKDGIDAELLRSNSPARITRNLRESHLAVCSQAVLPLFTDNFDFQTCDDFVRGLLMNEEIMCSTIYIHRLKENERAAAVTSWHMYQAISRELMTLAFHPIVPNMPHTPFFIPASCIGNNCSISNKAYITQSVIGDNCKIGDNVQLCNAYIMSGVEVQENCVVDKSFIGPGSVIKKGCKITFESVLGEGVVLPPDTFVEDTLVQSTEPEELENNVNCKLSDNAYKLTFVDDDEDAIGSHLAHKLKKMNIDENKREENKYGYSSDDETSEADSDSTFHDDTELFLGEVIDSLMRGYEEKLPCENLILEINSSRHAYFITLNEVNFSVINAILNIPVKFATPGQSYMVLLLQVIEYFTPILKNYIRDESAMNDCLSAIEHTALKQVEVMENVLKIVKWFYDRDYIEEELVLNWSNEIEDTTLNAKIAPLIKWLREADEEESD